MNAPQAASPRVSGRYELGDAIASGAMGSIHRAYDNLARRDVAYKRLRVAVETNRPTLTALFRREYDTLARLDHPSIVSVYDYGFDAHGPYYTMELLGGDDLARCAPLPVREACRVLRDVGSALALVHARRMVHRDVSPNNVRLTREKHAKLIDFGGLTPFGAPTEVVGTPAFIAPECLTTEELDQRVDLYALGALAYWALTRKLAVQAYSLDELPRAWMHPIAPPSSFVPEVPRELDELVLSLLARDRLARPPSAGVVVERLTNIAELEPERDVRRVAFSYLRHAPLRGRGEALGTFSRQLDKLTKGGSVLLIEGAPGSGRSALLEQFTIEAQLRGAAVLRADGSVQGGPLDAVARLVEEGLASYPDLLYGFRDGRSSALIETGRVRTAMEASERQARLSAQLKDAILRLGARGPLALLVDDAHLLDKQSLALLASLVESLARHPILIALTRTNEPARSDAEVVLQAAATRLQLAPLAEEDVDALVETMFAGVPNSRRLARWLYAESRGNPGHCLNLVELLLKRGDVRYTRGTFTLPHDFEPGLGEGSMESLLRARLAALNENAARVAHLLALHGMGLRLEEIAQAAALDDVAVFEALRCLGEQELLVASAGTYALSGRSACACVAAELTDEERRAYHLALARLAQSASGATLQQRLRAGMHLIEAGGDEELAGARLVQDLTREHMNQVYMDTSVVPTLEAAVAVFSRHGKGDLAACPLLISLASCGFWGDLGAQDRYFDRAMRALALLNGIALAMRLRPYLGPRLSLVLGILLANLYGWMTRRTPSWPLKDRLEAYANTVNVATAAAACALDAPNAERIVAWLEPFAWLPSTTSLQVSRQFAVATVEASACDYAAAVPRYEAMLTRLERPVPGIHESVRERLRYGCLHGIAQCLVELEPERALVAADKLASESLFFVPHAECIRMSYHAYRGSRDRAAEHRARAEALALLGGVSWSAVVLLTIRSYVASMLTDDVLGVVHAAAELERLSHLSPAIAAESALAQAELLRLRGKLEQARAAYARVIDTEVARRLPGRPILLAMHARALNESGDPAAAKARCEEALADPRLTIRFPLVQQLALAESALGEPARAAARLDDELSLAVAGTDSPLVLGTLHRDRAEVALHAGDAEGFERHFLAMQAQFRATQNPWLIQQCDALLTRAVRAGVRPGVLPRDVRTIEASSEDLDGATVIEPVVPVEERETSVRERA